MAISLQQLVQLSLELRVGLVASLVESVLKMYPVAFIQKYHQQECVEVARAFAASGKKDDMYINGLLSSIETVANEADCDGYSLYEIQMGADLIDEIRKKDGRCAHAAIECAAAAYAFRMLSALHFKDSDVSTDSFDTLQVPFWQTASDALLRAQINII